MKVVILAAGIGSRLKPLTNTIPKCMVCVKNKPILEHQIEVFKKCNLHDIYVVTGYKEDQINFDNIKKFHNANYNTTNMVSTLFCAKEIFNGKNDILISYGDIVFSEKVLKKIINSRNELNVVIDKKWKKYWKARMDDPLLDAETLKIGDQGYIKEIGKKPSSYDDIEGQYIGLIKIRKDKVVKIKEFYESLDKNIDYDGKNFSNMYMTSFLQIISENLIPLTPVYIENGWIEIDSIDDLKHTSFLNN